MNKFIAILIFQNILFFYVVFFIPVSILLKINQEYSIASNLILASFFLSVILIFLINSGLIKNQSLSFGFLRFIPFLLLLRKFNFILKTDYPDLQLRDYQKQIIIIYLMNKHVFIKENDYYNFSRLIKIERQEGESEFIQMVLNTPFWYELHEYSDHYSIDRQFLAEKGLVYNEKKFAFITLLCFLLYCLLLIIIYLT